MAEYLEFVCKNCGCKIVAPPEGGDMLMDSIVAYFVCHDCKHVFYRYFELGTVFDGVVPCPKCKGLHTDEWKPTDKCPECGGKLENKGLYCLED